MRPPRPPHRSSRAQNGRPAGLRPALRPAHPCHLGNRHGSRRGSHVRRRRPAPCRPGSGAVRSSRRSAPRPALRGTLIGALVPVGSRLGPIRRRGDRSSTRRDPLDHRREHSGGVRPGRGQRGPLRTESDPRRANPAPRPHQPSATPGTSNRRVRGWIQTRGSCDGLGSRVLWSSHVERGSRQRQGSLQTQRAHRVPGRNGSPPDGSR